MTIIVIVKYNIYSLVIMLISKRHPFNDSVNATLLANFADQYFFIKY